MPRVQGEGDYEAARRYRSRTEKFVSSADERAVSRAARAGATPKTLTPTEKTARKHAKRPEQDARDAAVFKRRSTGARKRPS